MHNPLCGYWAGCGINARDTVLIHSSMKRAFRYLLTQGDEANPKLMIDSLLDQVGNNGTVIFPLFNFDFPKTGFFSTLNTPS